MASTLHGFEYYVGLLSTDQSKEIEAVLVIYQLMCTVVLILRSLSLKPHAVLVMLVVPVQARRRLQV